MRNSILAALAALTVGACGSDGFLSPDDRRFNQFDRIGRPAINTVFIPTASKQDFNLTTPDNDRLAFTQDVVNFLTTVAGYTTGDAEGLAAVLLPDILTIDTSTPSAFLNGRGLSDDVITAELGIIFGDADALNDDHVDANDVSFGATFPYLAPPFLP